MWKPSSDLCMPPLRYTCWCKTFFFLLSFLQSLQHLIYTQINKQTNNRLLLLLLLWLFSLLDVWIGDGSCGPPTLRVRFGQQREEKERKTTFGVSSTWDFLAAAAGLQLESTEEDEEEKKKVPTRGANWANNWQTLERTSVCRAPVETHTHTNWWWMVHWLIIVGHRPYESYSHISRLK